LTAQGKTALVDAAGGIFRAIASAIQSLPHGLRVICAQLLASAKVTGGGGSILGCHFLPPTPFLLLRFPPSPSITSPPQRRFPNDPPPSALSLVGGFIFLRFVNPCVVAPDATHVLDDKVPPVARRNLVLVRWGGGWSVSAAPLTLGLTPPPQVAKVLQALSNGVAFGEKEAHMAPLNGFLDATRAAMSELLLTACQVNVTTPTAVGHPSDLNLTSQKYNVLPRLVVLSAGDARAVVDLLARAARLEVVNVNHCQKDVSARSCMLLKFACFCLLITAANHRPPPLPHPLLPFASGAPPARPPHPPPHPHPRPAY
jgi:hypothetical protein